MMKLMLKLFLIKTLIGIALVALIAYFRTGYDQKGIEMALYVVGAIYVCIGGLIFVTSSERKILDDLGRKKGMSDNELKYIYRNVSTTQSSGYPWSDTFGGDKKYISSGRISASITFLIGLIALFVAFGLSGY